MGLLPSGGAHAPTVARLQPRETGAGGGQIVPGPGREFEEFCGDLRAHRVYAQIVGPGVAAAVAVETGYRFPTAGLELAVDHVGGHQPPVMSASRASTRRPISSRTPRTMVKSHPAGSSSSQSR